MTEARTEMAEAQTEVGKTETPGLNASALGLPDTLMAPQAGGARQQVAAALRVIGECRAPSERRTRGAKRATSLVAKVSLDPSLLTRGKGARGGPHNFTVETVEKIFRCFGYRSDLKFVTQRGAIIAPAPGNLPTQISEGFVAMTRGETLGEAARRIGKGVDYVQKILDGHNMSLRSLDDVFGQLGYHPEFVFVWVGPLQTWPKSARGSAKIFIGR